MVPNQRLAEQTRQETDVGAKRRIGVDAKRTAAGFSLYQEPPRAAVTNSVQRSRSTKP